MLAVVYPQLASNTHQAPPSFRWIRVQTTKPRAWICCRGSREHIATTSPRSRFTPRSKRKHHRKHDQVIDHQVIDHQVIFHLNAPNLQGPAMQVHLSGFRKATQAPSQRTVSASEKGVFASICGFGWSHHLAGPMIETHQASLLSETMVDL